MKLGEWRKAEGLTLQQVADGLGCWVGTVARYESGARIPDRDGLKSIYIVTKGKVQPNDFHEIDAWEAERIRAEGDAELARKAA